MTRAIPGKRDASSAPKRNTARASTFSQTISEDVSFKVVFLISIQYGENTLYQIRESIHN